LGRWLSANEGVKFWLAVRNLAKKWTMPIRGCKPAPNRFAVQYAERFPK